MSSEKHHQSSFLLIDWLIDWNPNWLTDQSTEVGTYKRTYGHPAGSKHFRKHWSFYCSNFGKCFSPTFMTLFFFISKFLNTHYTVREFWKKKRFWNLFLTQVYWRSADFLGLLRYIPSQEAHFDSGKRNGWKEKWDEFISSILCTFFIRFKAANNGHAGNLVVSWRAMHRNPGWEVFVSPRYFSLSTQG